MWNQVKKWLMTFKRAFLKACPIIFFFLISFFTVYVLFGLRYSMIVSIITVFFQIRYKKNDNTINKYVRLLVIGSILMTLAVISSQSLLFCILLNLCVPFVLVFTQSSQFKPKGYFSYAMLFVFLSLIPPENGNAFWMELVAFWVCVIILVVSIWVFRLFAKPVGGKPMTLESALCELSDLMFLLIQPEQKKLLEERFQNLVHDFQQSSYHQEFFSIRTKENQIYDMMGALIQRFSYMITDEEWREGIDSKQILLLARLSAFLRETAKRLDTPMQEKQIQVAQMHLDYMTVPEGRIRIFCRSILHMTILILKTREGQTHWIQRMHSINWREVWEQTRFRFTLESFEMRMAMRLSMVMTISCTCSYVLPITHSYWIPLNAFLLLQPNCEESSYRMKTRPIGTLIGCGIAFFIHPFLTGIGVQLIFALLMISLMYCSTPGTWYHPIFSTCYALTLASMTMNERTAVTLRMVYLLTAVAIVFLVNRFFFPIRRENLFRYNMKALLRLNRSYWNIIRKGLFSKTDLSVSGEILTYFHMIYEECVNYVKKNASESERKDYMTVLLTLWHMFSELEQIHYLVRTGSISSEKRTEMKEQIIRIQDSIYPEIHLEQLQQLKKDGVMQKTEITYVLQEYLEHAQLLGKYPRCLSVCEN